VPADVLVCRNAFRSWLDVTIDESVWPVMLLSPHDLAGENVVIV